MDDALALYAKSEGMRPGYPEPLLNSAHIYQHEKKNTPMAHSLYRRMLDHKVAVDPSLKITDKNHMNLYALLAVQLAREIPQDVRYLLCCSRPFAFVSPTVRHCARLSASTKMKSSTCWTLRVGLRPMHDWRSWNRCCPN
jgi:hypothetical protein